MTSKDFAKKIIEIYKETCVELNKLEKVKISDDEMVNSDMEKTIKAQGYLKLEELIKKLK